MHCGQAREIESPASKSENANSLQSLLTVRGSTVRGSGTGTYQKEQIGTMAKNQHNKGGDMNKTPNSSNRTGRRPRAASMTFLEFMIDLMPFKLEQENLKKPKKRII